MLISDWSSDVCSSDLSDPFRQVRTRMGRRNACLQGPPYESPEMRRSLTIGRHCQKHASTKNPVQTLIPATSGGRALILPSNFLSNTFSMFSICSNLLFFRFSCEETTMRSEEHTSELQSLMRISYAVFCLKKKKYLKSHYILHITS